MTSTDILIKYWGYTSFRSKQEEIISSTLSGKDTLALLPTGFGKSICFQVPAIMMDGICIVVSPLIALMSEQVKYLQSKGVKSIFISSEMNSTQIDIALNNCIYGKVKFLYLSPERLNSSLLLNKINKMNINLITVDEAHCISEWGQNFRPAYRDISKIRDLLPKVPILALTATATKEVIQDIQLNLRFKNSNVISSSFFREKLSYVVLNKKDKYKTLLKLLKRIKSTVIIYVDTRKMCKEISSYLSSKEISANFYHAGLERKVRKKRQNDWMSNQFRVMIATNAFGMGINKTDVRLVINMSIPNSIESYFQMSGRAGRDGRTAYSVLLFSDNDINSIRQRVSNRYPDLDELIQCFERLKSFLNGAKHQYQNGPIAFDIYTFCKRYSYTTIKTYNMLNYMKKKGLISLSLPTYTPSKIKIEVDNNQLYRFQIAHQFYDILIKSILRSYTGVFSDYINIDEQKIAEKINMSVKEVILTLNRLEKLEILSYLPSNNNYQIKFLTTIRELPLLGISNEKIINDKNNELKKIENMISYIKNDSVCRSKQLLKYFGQEEDIDCGICDYCINVIKQQDTL